MLGSSLYTNIIGAILGIVLLLAVLTSIPSCLQDNVSYDPTLNNVIDELQKTKALDSGQRTAVISVPVGGAIVAMENGPFLLEYGFEPNKAAQYQHVQGFYMERPKSCGTGTCICVCKDIAFEDMSPEEYNDTFDEVPSTTLTDGKLLCKERQCAEANVSLKDKMWLKGILGEPAQYSKNSDVATYGEQYWNDSFLLLNSDAMRPDVRVNGSRLTLGGYAGKLRQSKYEVTMRSTRTGIQIMRIR